MIGFCIFSQWLISLCFVESRVVAPVTSSRNCNLFFSTYSEGFFFWKKKTMENHWQLSTLSFLNNDRGLFFFETGKVKAVEIFNAASRSASLSSLALIRLTNGGTVCEWLSIDWRVKFEFMLVLYVTFSMRKRNIHSKQFADGTRYSLGGGILEPRKYEISPNYLCIFPTWSDRLHYFSQLCIISENDMFVFCFGSSLVVSSSTTAVTLSNTATKCKTTKMSI